MEVVLDCFFDDVLSAMDRSCLSVRHKRREMVDYLGTLIMSCEDEKEGCRLAVLAALRYHDVHRKDNGSVCRMGKFHDVLYVAAKICFDRCLEDCTIVAGLLDSIFSCEKTFERLFIGSIFGTKVTHLICGWKTDFADGDESLRALAYFLSHAAKMKLSYEVPGPSGRVENRRCAGASERRRWGKEDAAAQSSNKPKYLTRLVDVPMQAYEGSPPLYVASLMERPKVLLLLLRFGAESEGGRGLIVDGEDRRAHSPLESHVRKLSAAASAGVRTLPKESASCLRVLMRASPRVAVPAEEVEWEGQDPFPPRWKRAYGTPVHPRLFRDGVILPSRWNRPPELRHLCRCTIRNALWNNWELPYGIRKLPLPNRLMNYVDLLDD
ncbi:uncharacterized protein LOC124162184 [Ischnura elegans]|uniref:uncharacterized protein LOC124162184 n=1 Tax=Ischnura elegans TaxID=197161 RepID=UPI001ED8A9ED|nr:uncharacterized protein LOC124162184 [Ischnura elegans]